MPRTLLLVVAFAIALASRSTGAAPDAPVEIWQTAEVEIAADGRVTNVRWLDDRPAARLVIDRIEPQVRTWQFEPGRIDGTPQATRTYLQTQLLAQVHGSGFSLRIGRVSTGPHAIHKVMPNYPRSAALAGVSAMVTAVLSVGSDGAVTFETLDYWRPGKRAAAREEFIEATRSALAQWKYAPERVGGRDVPVQVRIPVEFCAPETDCTRLFRDKDRSNVAFPHDRPGEAVALNSAVRLVTAVEGRVI